jgi:hypothetical protein
VVDMESSNKRGVFSQVTQPRMDLDINQVQFPRFRDPDDFPGKITVKSAYLCDNAVLRQTLQKNLSIWQHKAFTKVVLLELGSLSQQSLSPKDLVLFIL